MHVGSAKSACKECVLHRRTKQIALERKNFCTSLCVFFVCEPSDSVWPPGTMKSGGPPSLSIHPFIHPLTFSLCCKQTLYKKSVQAIPISQGFVCTVTASIQPILPTISVYADCKIESNWRECVAIEKERESREAIEEDGTYQRATVVFMHALELVFFALSVAAI